MNANSKYYRFVDTPTSELTESEWKEAADLFSNHYGLWGRGGVDPVQRIRLSPSRLKSPQSSRYYKAMGETTGR